MGEQHRELAARLDAGRERVEATRELDRAFTTGRSSPLSRIERGLAAQLAAK